MITNNEITLLQGLTNKKPIAVKVKEGEMTLLHAQWFVLEVPTALLAADLKCWKDEPLEGGLEWRTFMPAGESAYGQAIRFVEPENSTALVKLIADTGVAVIHPSIYEVVTKQFTEPEFRVFSEELVPVAIFNAGVLVGGVAQVKV